LSENFARSGANVGLQDVGIAALRDKSDSVYFEKFFKKVNHGVSSLQQKHKLITDFETNIERAY
jgi:hypothetical protein